MAKNKVKAFSKGKSISEYAGGADKISKKIGLTGAIEKLEKFAKKHPYAAVAVGVAAMAVPGGIGVGVAANMLGFILCYNGADEIIRRKLEKRALNKVIIGKSKVNR